MKYDARNLKCRRLLKALKKLRIYLYRVGFLVKIDTKTLVYQLNQPPSELLALVENIWLA